MGEFSDFSALNKEVILLSPALFLINSHDKLAEVMEHLKTGAYIAMPKNIYNIEVQSEKLKKIMSKVFILSSYGLCANYDEVRAKTDYDIYTFGYGYDELKILGKGRPVKLAINYYNNQLVNVNKFKNKKTFWEGKTMKLFNRKPTIDEAITKNKHDLHNNTITIEQGIDVYESLIIDYPKHQGMLQREINVLKDQQEKRKATEKENRIKAKRAELEEAIAVIEDVILQNTAKINKYSPVLAARTDTESFEYQRLYGDVAFMLKELEEAEEARKLFIAELDKLIIKPTGNRLNGALEKGIGAAMEIAEYDEENGSSTAQAINNWKALKTKTAPNHGRTLAAEIIEGDNSSDRPIYERIDLKDEKNKKNVDALIERAKTVQNAEDVQDSQQTRDFLAEVRASKKNIEMQTAGTC